jgi:hypothetical protein
MGKSYSFGHHYFKHITTGAEAKFCKHIKNGVLLSDFDPKDGRSCSNTEVYYSDEDFEKNWEKFTFKLPQNIQFNQHLIVFMRDFVYQLKNYGIEEEKSRNLHEFMSTINGCSMIGDWVQLKDKTDVDKFIEQYTDSINDDDDFFYDPDSIADMFAFAAKTLELAMVLVNHVEEDVMGNKDEQH